MKKRQKSDFILHTIRESDVMFPIHNYPGISYGWTNKYRKPEKNFLIRSYIQKLTSRKRNHRVSE